MDLFVLVLFVCIATYRITRLLVTDAFPPLANLRLAIARRFGAESSWAYLAECPYCASVYVAAALVAGVDLLTDWPTPLPVLFAATASGVASLIASTWES